LAAFLVTYRALYMNPFQPDNHPEGDGEDRGDLSWNEFEWQRFLGRQSREVARFCSFYDQLAEKPDHLDVIAQKMGWDEDDWTLGDENDDDEPWSGFSAEAPEEEENDLDPYTLHRHPVFIVGQGLIRQLQHVVELLIRRREDKLSPSLAWRFAMSLSEIEKNLLLALQSVDVGDYLLGIIHSKMVLRGVNDALALVPVFARLAEDTARFDHEVRKRLFDLREVSLRVMADCREEERGGFRDFE